MKSKKTAQKAENYSILEIELLKELANIVDQIKKDIEKAVSKKTVSEIKKALKIEQRLEQRQKRLRHYVSVVGKDLIVQEVKNTSNKELENKIEVSNNNITKEIAYKDGEIGQILFHLQKNVSDNELDHARGTLGILLEKIQETQTWLNGLNIEIDEAKDLFSDTNRRGFLLRATLAAGALFFGKEKEAQAKKRITKPKKGENLQKIVNDYVQDQRKYGKIKADEKTAWYVYDLEKSRTLVAINANQKIQAASMIKPFVALAYAYLVSKGRKRWSRRAKFLLKIMIQRSSNRATNWFIRQVGGPITVQKILDKKFPGICEHTSIVEYIPRFGRTYKNKIAVSDYYRFLKALWYSEIPSCDLIRNAMELPGKDRLFYQVPTIPKGVRVINKTGSTSRCIGDMGILVAKTKRGIGYAYIVAGVVAAPRRRRWYRSFSKRAGDTIRGVSGLTYEWMEVNNNLKQGHYKDLYIK